MEFGHFICNITKEKSLSKHSAKKNVAEKLFPGPFLLLKNPL